MENAVRNAVASPASARRALPATLGFGQIFADVMFRMRYTKAQGWQDGEFCPYGPLMLDPAAKVLHYGQEIFEGHKGYRWDDGRIALFRPDANAARMNRSARRMRMPEIPVETQLDAVVELVRRVQDWVPDAPGSLYLRPTMIATEAGLGVRAATEFLYYVIASPVGPYFPQGFAPIKVHVESKFTRAAEGGMGAAKTGGNYAGSLFAQTEAKERGYDAVLWLDAKEHRFIEEISAMNIFFVIDGQITTSPLTGSILEGITRDSVITLARDADEGGVERLISIDEIIEGIASGRVSEAFAAGTAAVITPVGGFAWQGHEHPIRGGEIGPMAQKYYARLTDTQWGRVVDTRGWIRFI